MAIAISKLFVINNMVSMQHRIFNLYKRIVVVQSLICVRLWPQGLQHTRLSCPSLSPEACLYSCPLSLWCHPTISSSVILFSLCLQSFPASGSFLMSCLFSSGGQNIGASASASVLPMNIQGLFPLMSSNNLTNLENDKD